MNSQARKIQTLQNIQTALKIHNPYNIEADHIVRYINEMIGFVKRNNIELLESIYNIPLHRAFTTDELISISYLLSDNKKTPAKRYHREPVKF